MCGIVGWVDFRRDLTQERQTLQAMTDTMRLRGPDAGGIWSSARAGLGHRRLSIIDLDGGAQPMTEKTPDGEVVLVYSGEVYNYRELRDELRRRGRRFRTESDTEVVLAAYLEWGDEFVTRLNGMFAFAIWNEPARELLLVRDRMGVKPLYFALHDGGILFASEPKGIMANPLFSPRLDFGALPILMQPRLAMPGETPLLGLRELRPGHLLRFDMSGQRETEYWAVTSRPHEQSYEETTAEVRALLEDIVSRQMISDVPRAALLSGGLDSTAVAALANQVLEKEGNSEVLNTFCVQFSADAEGFSPTQLRPEIDAPYAEQAAQFIGTNHAAIELDSAEVINAIPPTRLARDLPGWGQFDASMYLLFEQIRSHCTVALSGESADEVFGGYPWFFSEEMVNRPRFPWIGDAPRVTDCLADDLHRLVRPAEDEADRYATLRARVPRLPGEDSTNARMREVLYFSMLGPLTILLDRKDRMSMALGLEVRVPYCDHRLVEYMWNVPWEMKSRGGMKGLLKDAVKDLIPESTYSRKKSGYPGLQDPSYDKVLLGEVDWIVNDPRSPLTGMFDPGKVQALIDGQGKSMAWVNAAHMFIPLVEMSRWIETYNVSLA